MSTVSLTWSPIASPAAPPLGARLHPGQSVDVLLGAVLENTHQGIDLLNERIDLSAIDAFIARDRLGVERRAHPLVPALTDLFIDDAQRIGAAFGITSVSLGLAKRCSSSSASWRTRSARARAGAALILSPGVSFDFSAIDGMTAELADTSIPHAWKAGPQTLLLRKQLEAMPDGGVCAIVAPPNPFRCPPGPYERAAQIALYFSHHKPKSKVMIYDAKDAFSKQGLFQAGWKEHYGDMIEWIPAAAGGNIEAIDADAMTLVGPVADFEADVINLIPSQRADELAVTNGLVDDSGWCPVNQQTFESTLHPDIYVIGDAAMAGAMPKSGYAANSQGKVCAMAVAAAINGQPAPVPSYVNTCYSILAPDHGISVAGVYELKDGEIVSVPGAGGLSAPDADARTRAIEVQFAIGWYRNITADMFT